MLFLSKLGSGAKGGPPSGERGQAQEKVLEHLGGRLAMAEAKSNLASKGQIEAGRKAASPAHFGFPVPAGKDASDHAEDRNARLRMMIECDIIPSLMMAHGERFCVNPLISALIDVADFTALVMTEDEAAVLSHIDELRRRGLTVDMICVELLARRSRRGERQGAN